MIANFPKLLKQRNLLLALCGAALLQTSSVYAQEEVVAQICNEAGVCAPVDPLTALAIMGVKVLTDEFNKGDKGFGPNGAIMAAVNTVLNDLKNGGLGPNNDLVKAFEAMKSDLTKGPGENNDILKALSQTGVKI